jgi:hypothetical protein
MPMSDADRERLHEVLRSVARRALGKPEARVRELLEHELRAAGLSWSPKFADEYVRAVAGARSLSPRHLLRSLLRRFMRYHRVENQEREEALFAPEQLELEDLADRLLALPGVSRVRWHSDDCNRAIDVTIDAWSEETAEQVRQRAAPRVVRFINQHN